MLVVQAMLEAKDKGCLSHAASGGSATNVRQKGTCGWVLAIGKGNVIKAMESNGQAAGFPMASRRPEAYGAWSFLLAIARLSELCEEDPPEIAAAACGNEGLASKIQEILPQERPQFPSGTLQAGWDAASEAAILLKKCKATSLGWAKGHQDGAGLDAGVAVRAACLHGHEAWVLRFPKTLAGCQWQGRSHGRAESLKP